MTVTLSPDDLEGLAPRLSAVAQGDVRINQPLAPYTSYRIGGPTAIWVAPGSEDAVRAVLETVRTAAAPLLVLGRGSNLLVSDRGWPGITLYIGENLSRLHFSGERAEVGAGALLMDVIRAAVDRGLGGLEQMAGIPGGVGGALRMNAGAFGREIEAVTDTVAGFKADGSPCQVMRKDIAFGYRGAPQLEAMVITSAGLRFQTESAAVLRARVNEILALRERKQPLEHPSCGSVFKRRYSKPPVGRVNASAGRRSAASRPASSSMSTAPPQPTSIA